MDRNRGILSPEDRAYLRGEKNFESESGERQARRRIRERVRNALGDFGLLFHYMEHRDRQQVLQKFANRSDQIQLEHGEETLEDGPTELKWDLIDPDEVWYPVYTGGMRHTQAFLATLMFDVFVEEIGVTPEQYLGLVAELVVEGLQDAFGKKGMVVEADVDLSLEEFDVDTEKLRTRFERDVEAVTDREVEWLIHLREIGFEEMVEYVRDADGSEP